MDTFIKQASAQCGIDETKARSFTGMMMDFVQKNAPEEVSREISNKIPESQALIDSVKNQDQGGQDMLKPCMPVLDVLKNLLAPLIGKEGMQTAEVTGIMTKAGVNPTEGGEMIGKLLEFVKSKVGTDNFSKLTSDIPALQKAV